MFIDYILNCSECPFIHPDMDENSIQWHLSRLHKPYRFSIKWEGKEFKLIETSWVYCHNCSPEQMAENPKCPKPFKKPECPEIKMDLSGLESITDVDKITKCLEKACEENPKAVRSLCEWKLKTVDFFVGKIMRDLDKRGDIKTIKEIIVKHFNLETK